MKNKLTIGSLYFNPQMALMEKWSGFGVTCYWDNNDVAKFITFCLMFLNVSFSINIGIKK
jgi:hypothetical protein